MKSQTTEQMSKSSPLKENANFSPMPRFASIDFLRGLAIFIMIILHMISDFLDVDTLLADINNVSLINIVALLVLPFLGALAGFFLLVSSISNMTSMQRNLRQGKKISSIVVKQVVGGIVLLFFAMLSEGLIGYWGSFGVFMRNLKNPTFDISIAMRRWAHFEAIHAIAWCIILNGITQGLLSIREGWKNPRRQMLFYLILALIVVASTKFIWDGLHTSIIGAQDGIGYPWGYNTDGSKLYQPDIRTAGFVAVLIGIFVNPLAASIQPIFPYLAVSYIGSIIGIAISQPKKTLFKGFTRTVLLSGLVLFIVGAIGVVFEIIKLIGTIDFDGAVTFYRFISYHRHWYQDIPLSETGNVPYMDHISSFAWLWQFIVTTGFAIILTMMFIYLVEFRGRGSRFARRTGYIRRFGVIAFSNYNNQWLYVIPPLFIPLLFGKDSYAKLLWGGTIVQILTAIAFYTIILYSWGLINYRFSIEWVMKSIGYLLLPIRRVDRLKDKKWWQKGDVNMQGSFYHADWINIVQEDETYHKSKMDSQIAMKLSICALAIPIFFLFSIATLPMSIKARKKEGINKTNTVALILSIIGVTISVTFFVVVFVFTPANLGIYI